MVKLSHAAGKPFKSFNAPLFLLQALDSFELLSGVDLVQHHKYLPLRESNLGHVISLLLFLSF